MLGRAARAMQREYGVYVPVSDQSEQAIKHHYRRHRGEDWLDTAVNL